MQWPMPKIWAMRWIMDEIQEFLWWARRYAQSYPQKLGRPLGVPAATPFLKRDGRLQP
jgi:hypothetical protein